ncbi:MAG: Transcription elongation factor [uncultured bacterium]|nr:MAG: Transcription elongation factor [uncultured bacterium]
MTDKEIYVTPEGLEKLKSELEYLKTTKRKDIAGRIATAKELGDLSENAEYSEAKEEQSLVESRVLELEETLRRVKMIEKNKSSKTVVIGSHITVSDKANKNHEFDIVGSNEADPANGKISNESPLGKAFLGHKVGDEVKVVVPKGTLLYTLKKIA